MPATVDILNNVIVLHVDLAGPEHDTYAVKFPLNYDITNVRSCKYFNFLCQC
jgi:hypothetical protein